MIINKFLIRDRPSKNFNPTCGAFVTFYFFSKKTEHQIKNFTEFSDVLYAITIESIRDSSRVLSSGAIHLVNRRPQIRPICKPNMTIFEVEYPVQAPSYIGVDLAIRISIRRLVIEPISVSSAP